MCLLHVLIVRFSTIRQKRIHGGSTYAKCNSGQCDPAIVSLPRLARPGDTKDSVQLLARHHTRCTLNYMAEAGREGGTEGAREDGKEGGSKGRAGIEGATRWREEAMM